MKALSLRQPWAWLILYAGKDVENRTWSTSYRGPILLHASKTFDQQAIRDGKVWLPQRYTSGVTIPELPTDYPTGGIVGRALLADVVTSSASRWFGGAYGLLLKDAQCVPFVACPGKPILFEVPDEMLGLTRAGLCMYGSCHQSATISTPSRNSSYCAEHGMCGTCHTPVDVWVSDPYTPDLYICALYDERLGFAHWYRVSLPAQAEHGSCRTEVLWLNPKAAQCRQEPLFATEERSV